MRIRTDRVFCESFCSSIFHRLNGADADNRDPF